MSLQMRQLTRCISLVSRPLCYHGIKRTCSFLSVNNKPITAKHFGYEKRDSQRLYSTTEKMAWTDEDFGKLFKQNDLVVFIKGTPESPQCGFSKYVVQILYMHGCEDYKTFNVLDDDVLRARVKEFSDWPTIPQIYINGEFVGGFDILLQMHQSGDLIGELMKIGHKSLLIDADKTQK